MGFKPSALTPLPTAPATREVPAVCRLCSGVHAHGLSAVPGFCLECEIISGAFWQTPRALEPCDFVCTQVFVCVCVQKHVCVLTVSRPHRERKPVQKSLCEYFQRKYWPKAQLLITCIQMISTLKANTHTQTRKHTRCICTELVFHRAAVWWNADGADTWPFHQTVLTPQAPYLLCVQRCVCVSLCLWLPKCAHAGMWEDEVKEGENKNKYSPLNPSLGLVIETTSGKDKCPVCVSARHNHSFQPLWLL